MRINFRQGLISYQKNGGLPSFLQASSTPGFVSHIIATTPTVAALAQGETDYLLHFDQTIDQAWGPVVANVNNYLYWDIDLLTAEVTRGITTLTPITSATEPAQADGQHWFDTSTNTMKVFSQARNKWQTKIRVFAGTVVNGSTSTITAYTEGSQVFLNVPGNPGYILRDHLLKPLRKSTGEFLTDDAPAYVDTTVGSSGVLIQPVNRIVPVRAGEAIPAMSMVYFSDDDTVRLASSNQALVPMRIPVGIILEGLAAGDVGHLSPCGEISYDQWDWSGHAGEPLYIDNTGTLTLTRPNGLLAFRVGFVKNPTTVLLGVDAETYPQVYQSDESTPFSVNGVAPIQVSDSINGIGERVINISVDEVGATSGVMTVEQAELLASLEPRIEQAETDIEELEISKANVNHTHVIGDVDNLQLALDGKSDVDHLHDDRYSQLGHEHAITDVTGLRAELDTFAKRAHLTAFSEIYTVVDRSTATDAGSGQTLVAALAEKADVNHTHSLGDLLDVDLSSLGDFSVGDNPVLTYSGGQWIPQVAVGGSGQIDRNLRFLKADGGLTSGYGDQGQVPAAGNLPIWNASAESWEASPNLEYIAAEGTLNVNVDMGARPDAGIQIHTGDNADGFGHAEFTLSPANAETSNIGLTAGNSTNEVKGGDINISAGVSGTGIGGNVVIRGGDTESNDGSVAGSVAIIAGNNNTDPGVSGEITFSTSTSERFAIDLTGGYRVNGNVGDEGDVLTSSGPNASAYWARPAAPDVSFSLYNTSMFVFDGANYATWGSSLPHIIPNAPVTFDDVAGYFDFNRSGTYVIDVQAVLNANGEVWPEARSLFGLDAQLSSGNVIGMRRSVHERFAGASPYDNASLDSQVLPFIQDATWFDSFMVQANQGSHLTLYTYAYSVLEPAKEYGATLVIRIRRLGDYAEN